MSRRAISRFLPVADWLPASTPKTIRADVIAGIALAGLLVRVPEMSKDDLVILNVSGRGDKDMDTYKRLL